jgi:RNA-directed DNA polymerase
MEWRKWKRGGTRRKRLIVLGLDGNLAQASTFNGRGPWWNAGASHMNAALPIACFRRSGLILLSEEVARQTALRAAKSL